MFIVNKRKRKFELGDLVSYKERKFSFGMLDKKPTVVKGVITGTPDDDWVISHHYSVKNVIIHVKKLTMIKKRFILKSKMKYL